MPFVSSLSSVLGNMYLLSFDGENYQSIESAKYSHKYTFGLANYKGKALTVGCWYTGVLEIAQKVFEGDVVFPILIGRFFLDQSKSRTQHLLRSPFGSRIVSGRINLILIYSEK